MVIQLYYFCNMKSLIFSIIQSPLVSWSSQSTRWFREEWALRLSVKSNMTPPSFPSWRGSKTVESYLMMRGIKTETQFILTLLWKLWGKKTNKNASSFCDLCVVRFVVDTDSLTIKDVTDGDEGTYTCIMNTTLDQDSASAMLTVIGTSTDQYTEDRDVNANDLILIILLMVQTQHKPKWTSPFLLSPADDLCQF